VKFEDPVAELFDSAAYLPDGLHQWATGLIKLTCEFAYRDVLMSLVDKDNKPLAIDLIGAMKPSGNQVFHHMVPFSEFIQYNKQMYEWDWPKTARKLIKLLEESCKNCPTGPQDRHGDPLPGRIRD
jgi:hypothetical protein